MERQKKIEEFIDIAKKYNIPAKNEKITFFNEPLVDERPEDIKNADALLLDLEQTPHAFVLGCVMDLQIQAEKAWIIPYKVFSALQEIRLIKNYSIDELGKVPLEKYEEIFLLYYGKSLHRYKNKMAKRFYDAVIHIKDKYKGDASKIWANKPSSKEVVKRFREFFGIGQKISTMAANILFRKFGIDFSEYSYIDISLDIHITRVMKRLGLVKFHSKDKTFKDNILKETRVWNPEYPGIFDRVCFTSGRTWCHENKKPDCNSCILKDVCNKVGVD